jgi:hypothetical protein
MLQKIGPGANIIRQRPDQQRLREARHADDQTVAADEQRQQHLPDDVFLTDDELVELGDDLLPPRVHAVRERDVLRRIHGNGLVGDG